MISIIIPTLNEEKYLPLLLKSIARQKFRDYEIIVADAGSEDKTLDIAKRYNCRIVAGGLPAKGRNEGAKVAKGDLLLFLDADVILPQKFFRRAVSEFETEKIDFGAFALTPYPRNKISTPFITSKRLFLRSFRPMPARRSW